MARLTYEEKRALFSDPDYVFDLFKRHEAAVARFEQDQAKLLEEHPYRWVAVDGDGLVAWGESIEEVMQKVEGQGLSCSGMEVAYLDPDPPQYIL